MKFLKPVFLLSLLGCLFFTWASGQNDAAFKVRSISNLPYLAEASAERDTLQQLNLVLPETPQKTPLLVWIGGGAWSYVNRHMEMDFAHRIGQQGIAVASVGHRLSPAIWHDSTQTAGVEHPQHAEDIAAAVKWLHEHADQYGWDREQIFIGGFSSGAHLATLLALDSRYLSRHGLHPRLFRGVIAMSGTYDVANYHAAFLNGSRPELAALHVEAVFGSGTEKHRQASPISYVDQLQAPLLLMSDNNVYNYARIFEEHIRETDFREVQVVHAYHIGHGELWRQISYSDTSMYRDIILEFLLQHVPPIMASGASAPRTGVIALDKAALSGLGLPKVPLKDHPERDFFQQNLFRGEDLAVYVLASETAENELKDFPFEEYVYYLRGRADIRTQADSNYSFFPHDHIVVPKGFSGTWTNNAAQQYHLELSVISRRRAAQSASPALRNPISFAPEDLALRNGKQAVESLYEGIELRVLDVVERPGQKELRDHPQDELIQVVQGMVTLREEGGSPQSFYAGDFLVLPKGFSGHWESEADDVFRSIRVLPAAAERP